MIGTILGTITAVVGIAFLMSDHLVYNWFDVIPLIAKRWWHNTGSEAKVCLICGKYTRSNGYCGEGVNCKMERKYY